MQHHYQRDIITWLLDKKKRNFVAFTTSQAKLCMLSTLNTDLIFGIVAAVE